MVDINYVLNSFDGVIPSGHNKWKALCPIHGDDNPSISITIKDDKILMKCLAGCSTSDVLSAVGLTFDDLGSPSKKVDFSVFDKIAYGQRNHYGDGVIVKDHYDYISADGKYLYTKIRFEGGTIPKGDKVIRYYCIDYVNSSFKSGMPIGVEKTLYRLPNLLKGIKEGYPVYIVEGEKDVRTLENLGWVATTSGGANDWKESYGKYFKGADVRILPDNDEAGDKLAKKIYRDIKDFAYRTKIVRTSNDNKGDVTDYLNEKGHNKETLLELIQKEKYQYASWINCEKDKPEKVNSDRLAHTFDKHEEYLISRNFDGGGRRIYSYSNGVYVPMSDECFKGEIKKYILLGKATTTCLDNTFKFLTYEGNHFCYSDDINNNERIINLKNGILNIDTMELLPHSPKYKTTCQLQINYDANATEMSNFMKYINDLCLNEVNVVDEQKKTVIQEFMGLILSNVFGHRTKKAIILYSPRGDSGKSQLINLLQELLGMDRVIVVQLQEMNPTNRFVLANLIGARLVTCGDQTAVDVTDSSTFKQLTGSDMVKVERKGKDVVNFTYKGVVLYGCNALPNFKDDKGDHLFNRLLVIPCIHTVPEGERDSSILQKMLRERTAIFNWAMIGLKRLIANKFIYSQCDASATIIQEYRNKIDTVQRFIYESNYEITKQFGDIVNAKNFYEEYVNFCDDNEISTVMKRENFKERMASYGCNTRKSHGNIVYSGIRKQAEQKEKSADGFVDVLPETIPY